MKGDSTNVLEPFEYLKHRFIVAIRYLWYKHGLAYLVWNDGADGTDQLDDLKDEDPITAKERGELFITFKVKSSIVAARVRVLKAKTSKIDYRH